MFGCTERVVFTMVFRCVFKEVFSVSLLHTQLYIGYRCVMQKMYWRMCGVQWRVIKCIGKGKNYIRFIKAFNICTGGSKN